VQRNAIATEYLLRRRNAGGRDDNGWSENWQPVENVQGGAANNVPQGAMIRVTVSRFPHRLVTGSFFSWLPHYEGNWDVEHGSAATGGAAGTPVILVQASGSRPRE
jgi:hypothetical protein